MLVSSYPGYCWPEKGESDTRSGVETGVGRSVERDGVTTACGRKGDGTVDVNTVLVTG